MMLQRFLIATGLLFIGFALTGCSESGPPLSECEINKATKRSDWCEHVTLADFADDRSCCYGDLNRDGNNPDQESESDPWTDAKNAATAALAGIGILAAAVVGSAKQQATGTSDAGLAVKAASQLKNFAEFANKLKPGDTAENRQWNAEQAAGLWESNFWMAPWMGKIPNLVIDATDGLSGQPPGKAPPPQPPTPGTNDNPAGLPQFQPGEGP
ncbi:MAG: hypothetical protein LBE83_04270 [Propionibacteriaceae bacterium]|jgi:hypothetical protein|nr:hypothetical protein [Propionibacteriaceae bacterium]